MRMGCAAMLMVNATIKVRAHPILDCKLRKPNPSSELLKDFRRWIGPRLGTCQ